ncbi:MAG: DUF6288 domain-containing protein [Planctomycetota bacterium]|jgi:hypothetical protein
MGRTVLFSSFLVLLLLVPASAVQDPPPSPAGHSETCPLGCGICDAAVEKALSYLASKQLDSGYWESGNAGYRVVAASCCLALLASGSDLEQGPYKDHLKKAYDYFIDRRRSKPDHVFENWNLGWVPMFLAEIYVRTGDRDLRGVLEKIGQDIKENQEENGGYLHAPLKNGKRWPYGVLMATTEWNIATLGLIKKLGIPIPEATLEKALDWAQKATRDNGGVRYSDRRNQRSVENGRTSAMIHAYHCCGLKGKRVYGKMVEYFRAHLGSLPKGHSTPGMHVLTGAFASYGLGEEGWKKFWAQYRDWILSRQQADGSWNAMGPGGRLAGKALDTAWMVTVLQIPKGNLDFLLGKKSGRIVKRKKKGAKDRQPWLGVQVEPVEEGLKVLKTYSGSAARKLKMKKGDILLEVNGKKIGDISDLQKAVAAFEQGGEITVILKRGDEKYKVEGKVTVVPRSYTGWSQKKRQGWH